MTSKLTSIDHVTELFRQWSGGLPLEVKELPPSGSERKYYRIYYNNKSVIGAYNPVIPENKAFTKLTQHFTKHGIPVPGLLVTDKSLESYLITDLGDTTLFSLLPHQLKQVPFSPNIISIYKKALEWLPVMQTTAGRGLNYDVCYPRKTFDSQSMFWDLNYFKYFFLKIGGIHFDEQKLEDEFNTLVKWLSEASCDYFMFRDFQSRNIMVLNDKPWFIDYQGGRKGPLQYDVASLLFDAKANIPFKLRQELLNFYLDQLNKYINVDHENFIAYYYGFVLIRVFQAMGAYGYRGIHEKKPVFMQSIPYAQNNLKWLVDQNLLPENLPHLKYISDQIINAKQFNKYLFESQKNSKLKVSIRSFSYKKDYPIDLSGNGGGFVFDCRALPNPGRLEEFRCMSGKDLPVIQYLEKEPVVAGFIEKTSSLVLSSAKTYIERGFTNLMVCYGCTGGQHRSVYCAENLAGILQKELDVTVDLQHEQEGIAFFQHSL